MQTTTGRAGLGLRAHGDADYRLRLASMFGHVGIEYPEKSGMLYHVPVFRRSPDERRNMPLQLFILAPGLPGLDTYALTKDLENIRIIYSRLGIWVWTTVDPVQRARPGVVSKKVGKEELLVIPAPPGVNAAAPSWSDLELIAGLYPGLLANGASGHPPPSPTAACATDTIRVFYVPVLPGGDNGDTFTDLKSTNNAQRAVSFIADAHAGKIASGMGSSAAHEIGHVLTNHPDGHYVEPVPPLRLHAPSNLMARGDVGHMGGVASSQRLWDSADGLGQNQWSVIRSSRYTRG